MHGTGKTPLNVKELSALQENVRRGSTFWWFSPSLPLPATAAITVSAKAGFRREMLKTFNEMHPLRPDRYGVVAAAAIRKQAAKPSALREGKQISQANSIL